METLTPYVCIPRVCWRTVKTMKNIILALTIIAICWSLPCCLATDVGDEESVHMTVVVGQPIGTDRYSCFPSPPDEDADFYYARYVKTRTNDYSYNYYNRQPTGNIPAGRPGSFRVLLEANYYDNNFGIFYCRARKSGRLLTTITATVLHQDVEIVPADGLYTKTVNCGDTGVVIEMAGITASSNEFAWRFNDSGILQRGSSSRYLIDGAITEQDAGVYECHYYNQRQRARQGLVRLIVRGCPAGRWGIPNCTGVCDKCYNGGICNDKNGRCVCPAGFTGENCLNACGPNAFGFSCEIRCSRSGSCDRQVFCLPDPLGCTCAAGFRNYDCETACGPGKFGASCLQDCHCRFATSCDSVTGECTGQNNRCSEGWSGDSCQIPEDCGNDYYGTDCTRKCQCMEDQPCDKLTGECSNEQCKLGYHVYPGNSNCEECRGETFGPGCAQTCNCDEVNCNKASGVCSGGCKPNWATPDCIIGVLDVSNTKVNSGQPSVFTCIVTGSPLPSQASVVVSRPSNGEQFTSDSSTVDGSDRVVTFSILAVERNEDFVCYIVSTTARFLHSADMFELPELTTAPRATDIRGLQVTIEWDAWNPELGDPGDPPIMAYTVYYRRDDPSAEWERSRKVPSGSTRSATVDNLEPETEYELAVSVTREGPGGEGARSPTRRVTTLCSEPLMGPDDVEAVSRQQALKQLTITWQSLEKGVYGCSTGITEYRIRYISSTDTTGEFTIVDVVNPLVTIFNLSNLEPFLEYGISVSAVNEIGPGPWSEEVAIYTPEEMPPTPKKVSIPRSDTKSITVLTLATQPYNLNGNVSHYLLMYRQVSGGTQEEAVVKHINETGFKMTYTITDLPSETDFSIQVKIVNGVGDSDWSEPVQARTVVTGEPGGQTGLSGGVVGAIVGVLLLVIASVLIVAFVARNRKHKRSPESHKMNDLVTVHNTNGRDNVIYENAALAEDSNSAVVMPAEIHVTPTTDGTIYENTVPKDDPLPVVVAPAKNHIPPKPNRKPPPPLSNDKKPTATVLPIISVPVADDSLAEEKPAPDIDMKQPSEAEPETETPNPTQLDQSEYGNVNLGPQLSIPIPVGGLDDYIARKKASSTDSLKYEFSLLPSDQTKPWTVASNADLKTRNRFKNIIPYDHSRVSLEPIEGVPLSNYYNASYIKNHKQEKAFIAAMGPNGASLNDFWRMIWQKKINIIVMATQLVENGKDKCKRYWPARVDKEEKFGKLVVKLIEQESFSDYTIHTIQVYQAGQDESRRTIKHFNITCWPDMGVPLYPTTILSIVRVVKDTRSSMALHNSTDADGPILVHCSAGVGRTGTFIAIYTLMDMIKEQGKVSVFGFVNQMREDRVNMVQTYDQYAFIYLALLEGYLCGDTRIPVRDFVEEFTRLKKPNPKTRKRYIEEEFKTLNRVTPLPEKSAFSAALLPENADKNRFADVLPLERNRPFLVSAAADGSTNYINAAFVDTFKHKDAFIMTQMPLPNTVADIWRLVYDWNCATIVMMSDSDSSKDEVQKYWPDSGVEEFGAMSVEVISQSKGRVFNSCILKVSCKDQKDKSITIKHFQLQGWASNEDKPNSPLSILELLDAVQNWHQECKSTSPVIVQCINGVGRSGVFCTISTIVEKMAQEEVVDVFQAVKRLRMNRPQMIECLDQYILCYEVILQHLDRFKQYDNLH